MSGVPRDVVVAPGDRCDGDPSHGPCGAATARPFFVRCSPDGRTSRGFDFCGCAHARCTTTRAIENRRMPASCDIRRGLADERPHGGNLTDTDGDEHKGSDVRRARGPIDQWADARAATAAGCRARPAPARVIPSPRRPTRSMPPRSRQAGCRPRAGARSARATGARRGRPSQRDRATTASPRWPARPPAGRR